MTLLAGDNFSPTIENDSINIILNESALAYYGFEDLKSTIGKILKSDNEKVSIKGIINDFNQQSLKEMPGPIAFFNQPANTYYSIKANMAGIDRLIPELEKIWSSHYPGNPFHYFFMDDFYNNQYLADQRFNKLFLASSILAIVIACLGLYGLSSYAITRRTKEIGIRKVNGARIAQVMVLLDNDFVKWVVLAIVIATPLAWFAMYKWLQNFAYRTELSWWIFVSAGVLALMIALLTVSWQSWRAATRNPVEALRYE